MEHEEGIEYEAGISQCSHLMILANMSILKFCMFCSIAIDSGYFSWNLVYILLVSFCTAPPKRHMRVLMTTGAWLAFLYFFWKIGDPFPILSPKHGWLDTLLRKKNVIIILNYLKNQFCTDMLFSTNLTKHFEYI